MTTLPLTLYVSTTSFEERQQQCQRILVKHGAGVVPIVLQAVGKNAKVNFTALPASATVADLVAAVREVGDVSKKSACALQVAGCTPSATASISDVYAACASDDGFLYVCYADENHLGGCVPNKRSRSRPHRPGHCHHHQPGEVKVKDNEQEKDDGTVSAADVRYYREMNQKGIYPVALPLATSLYGSDSNGRAAAQGKGEKCQLLQKNKLDATTSSRSPGKKTEDVGLTKGEDEEE